MNSEQITELVKEIKKDSDARLKRLQEGIKASKENRRKQAESPNH